MTEVVVSRTQRWLARIRWVLRMPWEVRRLGAELHVQQEKVAVLQQELDRLSALQAVVPALSEKVDFLGAECQRLSALQPVLLTVNDKVEFLREESEGLRGLYESVTLRTVALEQQASEKTRSNGDGVQDR